MNISKQNITLAVRISPGSFRQATLRFTVALLSLVTLCNCAAPGIALPTEDTGQFPSDTLRETTVVTEIKSTSTTQSANTPSSTTTPAELQQPTQISGVSTPEAVTLAQDQVGFRLDATTGQLVFINWLDSSHPLVYFSPSTATQSEATYIVDMNATKLHRIKTNSGQPQAVVQSNSQHPVLLWGGEQAVVVDLQTGDTQTVFARDPSVPQWATAADHLWDFGDLPGSLSATWAGANIFVLTIAPQDSERNLRDWGKVMLVDIAARRLHVLTEQGHLAAVFPDGGLLVRQGWINGELQLFTPNMSQAPTQVSPGGFWTDHWIVSPDGQKVAWLEWTPPPGDWSDHLPRDCCSGDPHPTIHAIAVWDRNVRQIQHFPVADIEWINGMLAWRTKSDTLLFSSNKANSAALFQLTPDGKQTLLVQHPWYGRIDIYFEETNGTLYYGISGRDGQNDAQLMRRHPNGKLDTLAEMDFSADHPVWWTIDGHGNIIFHKKDKIEVQDMVTGQIIAPESIRNDPLVSPDGQWIVQNSPGATIRITKTR